jgi:hypothetical protein
MGTLPVGTQTFNNLTIAIDAGGFPDYDWYRVAMGATGTFAASITLTAGGPIEEHLFTLQGNTLNEVMSNTLTAKNAPGVMAMPVNAGDTVLVEVKFVEIAPGVASGGAYNMSLTLQ